MDLIGSIKAVHHVLKYFALNKAGIMMLQDINIILSLVKFKVFSVHLFAMDFAMDFI